MPGAFLTAAIICVGAFIFVFVLLIPQAYYVLANTTAWESHRSEKITYLAIYPRGYLPFYKGKLDSLHRVFWHGGELVDWKLPDPQAKSVHEFFNWFENKYWSC